MLKLGRFTFFPPLAGVYLLGSIVAVFSLCLVLDRLFIPMSEKEGKLPSRQWKQDDGMLYLYMINRNKANNDCPVWRSEGWPVSEKKTSAKRVLVIGDSFVWGHGYANMNDIWWRQLGKELKRRGYRDVEVIGAGLSGATTKDQLGWIEQLNEKYSPDLILWGYVTNDPDSMERYGKPPKYDALVRQIKTKESGVWSKVEREASRVFPALTYQMFHLRRASMEKKLSSAEHGYSYPEFELKILEGENFALYKRTVASLASFVRESRKPFFVMNLPNGYEAHPSVGWLAAQGNVFTDQMKEYFRIRYEPVKKVFAENNLSFLDILDSFVEAVAADSYLSENHSALKLGVNPVNGHPGPMATHFFAVKAADYLEAKHAEILGKKSDHDGKTEPKVNDWLPPWLGLRKTGSHSYRFCYPKLVKDMVVMPIDKPHVQLSFEDSSQLEAIALHGANLKAATIYLGYELPDRHFHSPELIPLGTKYGASLRWDLRTIAEAASADCLLISAEFSNNNHDLDLALVPKGEQ